MSTAFACQNVSVERSGNRLLSGVSLTVNDTERWVILGPNGAGKTTLLRLMSGNIHPTKGEVHILGQRLGTFEVRDMQTRVGLAGFHVAERIPPSETVHDVVISSAYAVLGRWNETYDPDDERRAVQIMGEMGISHLANRKFGTLSEGERKRTLIARALMTDPEMLLLDEPGAGLDLGGREDLVMSLATLAQEPAAPVIVMVTHHVEEIPEGFTHVLMLRGGEVIAAGPISATLNAENLSKTYGMPLTLAHADGRYAARRESYGRRANF